MRLEKLYSYLVVALCKVYVTPGFKEQNQASHMCAQEVHTYNNTMKYIKTVLHSGNILVINTYIKVSWNSN